MDIFKIARKVLPQSTQMFLGNRNKVKRHTLDALLFSFKHHPHEERLLHERASTRNVPEASLEGNRFIDREIMQSYRYWYTAEQIQHVTRTGGGVLIEPVTGWPMGKGRALYASLFFSGSSSYLPVPSYRTIFTKTPVVHFDKVISLRDVNERGYSHFYTDLIAKLVLLKTLDLPLKDYTVIISRKLAETAYGKFLLAHMPLMKQFGPLYLQDNEFVSAEEAIFADVFGNPTNSPVFAQVVESAKAAHPLLTPVQNRKIFLIRGKHRRRTMQNVGEIADILAAKGFESVDADDLTLPQQIELFANCRHLVGIHGAGLANMLYRAPNPMSLFEICETNFSRKRGMNAQYHNMAVSLGFDYGCTRTESRDVSALSFYLPPERFIEEFERFWAAHGD